MITSREYFSVVLTSMNLYLYDELNYERNLIGTHDLLQDRCTDNAIDNNILPLYLVKQIDFMLLWVSE